jgi:hypothetical protein
MINNVLKDIARFVHQYNSYFTDYFPIAWQDRETGCVFAENSAGDKPCILPNDTLGDMFFLIPETKGNIVSAPQFAITDIYNTANEMRVPVRLVAFMDRVDHWALLQNLTNTLQAYTTHPLQLTQFMWDIEQILAAEMKGAEVEDMAAAMQRLATFTAVSISFSINTAIPFQTINCIKPPCKC